MTIGIPSFSAMVLTALASLPTAAIECPSAPEQASKDSKVAVQVAVGKLGPIKAGDISAEVERTTRDLLGKLPSADKVYLEQMMFTAYCTTLRDDKSTADSEKAKLLRDYAREVRGTLKTTQSRPSAPTAAGTASTRKSIDDTEYVKQPYTTEADGRQTKSLTCPGGKSVVPGTAKCMNTGGNAAILSEQIGSNTWRCQWPYQAVGIGIWVEMACRSRD